MYRGTPRCRRCRRGRCCRRSTPSSGIATGTLRLFDFHYRISLYTPAAQRTHGYFVLPFLLGDRLVARVDVKADRVRSALVVPAAYAEEAADRRAVAADLADELSLVASWLELDRVKTGGQGDLGPMLGDVIKPS